MRVQLDRFEDNRVAVLLLYPEGRQSFEVPRELLTEDALARDVFEANLAHDREETEWMAAENRQLLADLLGRDDG